MTAVKRDDEPTQVTKLLEELQDAREKARDSLVAAAARANGIRRRLRLSDSERNLRAMLSEPPEPEPAE